MASRRVIWPRKIQARQSVRSLCNRRGVANERKSRRRVATAVEGRRDIANYRRAAPVSGVGGACGATGGRLLAARH